MRQYLMQTIGSMSGSRETWLGKIDIAKYYQNINHAILKQIVARHIEQTNILYTLFQVIDSFGEGASSNPIAPP